MASSSSEEMEDSGVEDSDVKISSTDEAGPTGMAQVMANILASSTKKAEKLILSKASEDKRLKRGEEEKKLLKLKREAKHKRQLAKLAWEKMAMAKPSVEEKDRERNLAKVATKGVVQLFNAVATQQDRLKSKLADEGTTDVKRSRIVKSLSRSSFIDLLKAQAGSGSVSNLASVDSKQSNGSNVKRELKVEPKQQKPKWKILHDDFVQSEFASGLGAAESDGEGVKSEPR